MTAREDHRKGFSCFTYTWSCFHSCSLLVSTRIISIFRPGNQAYREVTCPGFVWALELGQRRNWSPSGAVP